MIELEESGVVWRAMIKRPEKANSLTADMLNGLADFAERARGRASALVLTGRGKVFSAGADLEAAKAGLATDPAWERLSGAVARFDGLSLAALNGTAAGGALGMVLACDLRLAVPATQIFYPVMKLGFLPQPSDPPRLTELVGPARAAMIFMAGQKIDAATARDWGLIDRIVEPEELERAITDLTAAIAAAKPGHPAAIKALLPPRAGRAST